MMQYKEAERHAATGDANLERPDWTIDQGWATYSPDEHAVWKTLFERQTKLLPGRACDEFVLGMRAPGITSEWSPPRKVTQKKPSSISRRPYGRTLST